MTSKKSTLSDAERAMFREAIKGTRRLKNDRVQLEQEKPVIRRRSVKTDASHVDSETPLSDPAFPEDLDDQEYLAYEVTGVQRNTLRKLRRGQLPFFAELDLHGCTIDQARQLVEQLLSIPRPSGHCARIIHGRGLGSQDGRGVLKKRVAYWLCQHPAVLAYYSAQPMHGGSGAVYVLLKNHNKN